MKTTTEPRNPRRAGHYMAILAFSVAALAVTGCSSDSEDGELIGVGSGVTGNAFYFEGQINNSLTSSCGSATADTGTSTGTTGTSTGSTGSTGSGGTETEATAYKITSFYIFDYGSFERVATLLLKYTYYTNRDSFSITPTSSNTTTCTTSDFISCDTAGTKTCTTSDSVNCGGENSIIFTCSFGACDGVTFEASTGIINWENGFVLSDDKTAVSSANLDFRLVNSTGSVVVVGDANCESTNQ